MLVADPARGVERLSRAAFRDRWSGHLLPVAPESRPPSAAAILPPVGPRRRSLGLLGPHTPILAEAFACAPLMTVLGVATSYFLQHPVNSVPVRSERKLLDAPGVGMVRIVLLKARPGGRT
jgi:ABC-type bacteriocin/lantibiotic exporter with double-glycine peptidase domain